MIYENEIDKSKYKIEFLGEKFSKEFKVYKVIIIGRYGVGKTTILGKLMYKNVEKEYAPTVSIDIKNLQMKVNDKIIQIQIWDCCGNDKYAQSLPNLFKNTYIVILVYSINDRDSFEDLKNWYNLVKEHSFDNIIFLIGNKNCSEKEREVTNEEGDTFKNNYDNIKLFLETSALNGNNIDKLLDNIAISIYEKDINDENKLDNAIKGGRITLIKEDFKKIGNNEEGGQGKKKKKKFC